MATAGGEHIYNLVITYRMNRYKIINVRSDRYTHLQLLSDVSDLVLRDVPSNVSLYISLNLPIPGTQESMEVQTDADLKTMFQLYPKSEYIDIILLVTKNPPLISLPKDFSHGSFLANLDTHPNWLSLDYVRRRGKTLAETEDIDKLLSLESSADLTKLAGMLRTQKLSIDGYIYNETGWFSNAVFKSPDTSMLLPPMMEQLEPIVDDVEIEQWLNLNDSPDK